VLSFFFFSSASSRCFFSSGFSSSFFSFASSFVSGFGAIFSFSFFFFNFRRTFYFYHLFSSWLCSRSSSFWSSESRSRNEAQEGNESESLVHVINPLNKFC